MSQGSSGQDKTEDASALRLQEARRDGQIARTPDIGGWLTIAVVAAAIPWTVGTGATRIGALFDSLGDVAADPEPAAVLSALSDGAWAGVVVVAPIAGLSVLLAVAGNALQGGLVFSGKALTPSWKRINPIEGFKNHYGPRAAWEGLQTAIKTLVLVLVTWYTVKGLIPLLISAGQLPLSSSLDALRAALSDLVSVSVGIGLAIAVVDLIVRRRRLRKDLRMTKQEVKDESKRTEGDPLLKSARRSRQIAISRNRMLMEIANADAVIVNPTHVAVAIAYDASKGAPRVVAKGAGHVATRIRAEAAKHRVPLVADIPLARTLYKTCRLGDEIPPELYAAVAQVLAFLMAMRRTRRLRTDGAPVVVPRAVRA
jgi:flagellar biosynthetic protein FlhB